MVSTMEASRYFDEFFVVQCLEYYDYLQAHLCVVLLSTVISECSRAFSTYSFCLCDSCVFFFWNDLSVLFSSTHLTSSPTFHPFMLHSFWYVYAFIHLARFEIEWMLTGAGIDPSSLMVVEGKLCWDLYIDGLVVSSDGNLLDALGAAIKVICISIKERTKLIWSCYCLHFML